MTELYKMCDLPVGKSATIFKILPLCPIRLRLYDIGLIDGTEIKCLFQSAGKDMKAYLVRGSVIAIRNSDCAKVLLSTGVNSDEK